MNNIKFGISEPSLEELQGQEQQLAAEEMDLSLTDAALRGREATVSAQRSGLERRALWIDNQVERLNRWAVESGVDVGDELVGLGDGAALREADVEAYVDRSKTLLVSRQATLAARREMLKVRQGQLSGRQSEVEELEQAFIRAEVRLIARERMLMAATVRLGRSAAEARPGEEDAAARPVLLPTIASHIRHAVTVTMTADEMDDDELPSPVTPRTASGKPAPPVLSVTSGGTRQGSGVRRDVTRLQLPRLTLADRPLRRSQVEVDRDGGVILVSLRTEEQLPDEVDFVYLDENEEASHLEVVLKMLMPTAGGTGNAVVLSTQDWQAGDFKDFEKMLASLPG